MNDDTPSPLARRITRRIIAETGYTERPEKELLELVHTETKDLRPIHAYASSLKQLILRIIEASDPHAELRVIAASLGIPLAE
jgi:hypothetical protein